MKLFIICISLLLSLGCIEEESLNPKNFEPGVINPQSIESKLLMNNPWCVYGEVTKEDGRKVKATSVTIYKDIEGNASAAYYEEDKLISEYNYKYKLNYPFLTWDTAAGPLFKQIEISKDKLQVKHYYQDKKNPHLDLEACQAIR